VNEIAQKALKRALLMPFGRDVVTLLKIIEFTQHCALFTFSIGFEAGGAEQFHGVFDHHFTRRIFPTKLAFRSEPCEQDDAGELSLDRTAIPTSALQTLWVQPRNSNLAPFF